MATTIVNIALPVATKQLHLSPTTAQWVIDLFILTYGGFLLLAGRASDLLGARRVFLAGMVGFALASLLGGLAWSGPVLVLARGAQGVGAALISSAALTILTALYPPGPARTQALGVWGAVGAASLGLGLLVGGVLTSTLGWTWVLLYNVPLVALALLLSRRLLPADAARSGDKEGFDLGGGALALAGLMAVVYALVGSTSAGWLSARTLGMLAAGLGLLAAFGWVESRQKTPLLRLSLFQLRDLSAANALALLKPAGAMALAFFTTLYVQQRLHYSLLATGLAFLPFAALAAAGAPVSRAVLGKLGLRASVAASLGLMLAGLAWLAWGASGSSYWLGVVPGMLLLGFGSSLSSAGISVGALAGVPAPESGMASGLLNTSQHLGSVLTLAVLVSAVGGISATAEPVALLQRAYWLAAGLTAAAVVGAVLWLRPVPAKAPDAAKPSSPAPAPVPKLAG